MDECNHRQVKGPLTLAINPKQTHQYHCVLQCGSLAYLRVIFSLRQGTSDREFMLDCHCPAQTSACNSRPILEKTPGPDSPADQAQEIAQILQFWINGCRTQDPRPLSPPRAGHWCLPKDRRFFFSS